MKNLFLILISFWAFACNQHNDKTQILQNRVDSLESKLADTYKPGFGEFMSSIQIHHNKLWFAGQNQNWKLADFEIHEIMENIDAIKKYQTERKESKKIDMIQPALDSMNVAIHQKNPIAFRSSYILLTNTCNSCHRATEFEFNVVKIPENPPFSNQDFKPQHEK
ncbi:MAG: hypothetical protein ABI208_00540 [Ginsengibacter sp.]|jgi:hypothetical protein